MDKITNTTVIKELNKSLTTFYDWKRREPRAVELIKKGLLAEKVLSPEIFEDKIKKENVKDENGIH